MTILIQSQFLKHVSIVPNIQLRDSFHLKLPEIGAWSLCVGTDMNITIAELNSLHQIKYILVRQKVFLRRVKRSMNWQKQRHPRDGQARHATGHCRRKY